MAAGGTRGHAPYQRPDIRGVPKEIQLFKGGQIPFKNTCERRRQLDKAAFRRGTYSNMEPSFFRLFLSFSACPRHSTLSTTLHMELRVGPIASKHPLAVRHELSNQKRLVPPTQFRATTPLGGRRQAGCQLSVKGANTSYYCMSY